MCRYMHIHPCVFVYIYTTFYVYIHTCMYLSTCIHIRACIFAYTHVNTHTYIHTYIQTHANTHLHTCMHACMHAYMHTCTHTHILTSVHLSYMHACMHAYVHSSIHTYIHTGTGNKKFGGAGGVQPNDALKLASHIAACGRSVRLATRTLAIRAHNRFQAIKKVRRSDVVNPSRRHVAVVKRLC